MSTDERMIKLKFSDESQERGWAEDLGHGLARISNIPFSGELNLDDIVRYEADPDGNRVVELISRRFPVRTTIWYDEVWQLYKIAEMLRLMDGRIEGGVDPDDKDGKHSRGFAMVACTENVDPVMLAEAIGIPQPKKTERK